MSEQCACLQDTNTWLCTYNTTKERYESRKPTVCSIKNAEQCAFTEYGGPYNFLTCLNTECDDYVEGERDYIAGYAPCPKCEKDRAVTPSDPTIKQIKTPLL